MTKMDYHNNNSNVSECCESEMTAAGCMPAGRMEVGVRDQVKEVLQCGYR